MKILVLKCLCESIRIDPTIPSKILSMVLEDLGECPTCHTKPQITVEKAGEK